MQTVKINAFKSRALKYAEDMMPDEEIKQDNITELFYDQIPKILERGELINWQIFGEVTSGKSVVMCHLVDRINRLMNVPMSLDKIMADQIEFREFIQKEQPENICIGIDEWNEMGTQGMNATTEEKFLTWISDVMAQKYVHRISCSPETQVDRRANVLIEILGKDTKRKITRCLVKYRIVTAELIKPQLIGYIDVPVGNILETDWYKRYRKRKMDKIELVRSKGISDPRKIEQAGLILNAYNELKQDAEKTNVDSGEIALVIDQIITNNSLYLSIITTSEIEKKISGMLKATNKAYRMKEKANQLKRKHDWAKGKEYDKAAEIKQQRVQKAINELERLQKVYEEYRAI